MGGGGKVVKDYEEKQGILPSQNCAAARFEAGKDRAMIQGRDGVGRKVGIEDRRE